MTGQLTVSLSPAIYSKAQSAEQIAEHIKSYPKQDTNNIDALKHSIEFQIDGRGPVATLHELRHVVAPYDVYLIYPRSGGGIVKVGYNSDDTFTVLEVAGK